MLPRSKTTVLAVMCGVVAMTVLDLSVVNVALPSIQAELRAEPEDLQWVVVVYGVVVAGFLMLGGRAGDLAGHRRMLLAGVGMLAGASLIGGLAGSLEVLVAARAGQGLGAALAAPNALAILSRTFIEGSERNRALGIFGAAGGTAAIGGSIVGGLLTQGPGWEWVFLLNVPLGVALLGAIVAGVPRDAARQERGRADAPGAGLLTAGLLAVALGVHQSVEHGWLSAATLGPVGGGLVLLAGFVAWEGRSAAPLVPLGTLRKRPLLLANLAAALLWASFLGFIYLTTLFAQQQLGWGPLAAGASTIPIAVLSLGISAAVAPRVVDRVGPATTLAGGMAVLSAGVLLLVRVPADASYVVDMLGPYCLIGLGLGFAEVSVQIAAFTGIEAEEAGLAGGALETSREMGGALGLAVLVSLSLAGSGDGTEAYHLGVLGAAVLGAGSAGVAALLIRPARATS